MASLSPELAIHPQSSPNHIVIPSYHPDRPFQDTALWYPSQLRVDDVRCVHPKLESLRSHVLAPLALILILDHCTARSIK